ncbi:MAG: hypothetical protein Q4Q07_00010 [Tissierellia bacterium]|nr:hypothetical protein [Tissierellia bacterium]
MKGRQVIKIKETLNLDDLEIIFKNHWKESSFTRGKVGAYGEYIRLPATDKFRVLVYPKKKALVLITYYEEGKQLDYIAETSSNMFFGPLLKKIFVKKEDSMEHDRTTNAESYLIHYTNALRDILIKQNLAL